ncbi:MAG: condensation domain-containing protein, partial [Pseudomonadota bacterium]
MESVLEFLGSLGAIGVKLSRENDQLHCYAPQGVLNEEIKQSIGRLRPQIMALLPDGPAPEEARSFPLSVGQKGLYVLQQLDPDSSAYNVPLCFTSRRGIQVRHLARAWELLQARFPILQARIVEEDGRLLHRLDGSGLTALSTQAITLDATALPAFLRERAQHPFDLRKGPLTRAELFTESDGAATLLITIHHIVVDGISSVILLKQLFGYYLALCAGQTPPIPQPSDGWTEFVAWEENLLASPEGQALGAYWKNQLDGAPPSLDFPPVTGVAGGPDAGTGKLVLPLDAALSRRIRDFSITHATPLSAIFLAAYQLLLHRYTNQDDIVVTMPVMGRAGGRFHSDVGYFVNMVPLRSRYSGAQPFQAWLEHTQRTMMDALYHSSYPLPLIVNDLKLTGANAHDVFGISYAYQNVLQLQSMTLPDGQGFDVEMVSTVSQEGSADLGLEIFEDKDLFSLHLKYAEGMLSAPMAGRMLDHLRALLEAAVTDPACQIQQYPLIAAAEQKRLREVFNNTGAAYDQSVCIHELFAAQASRAA